MSLYRCELCSYEYDEDAEGQAWETLGTDWACPVCGSDQGQFEHVEPEDAGVVAAAGVYRCGLCSYAYDEDAEGVAWAALPAEWVCPVCGSSKGEFKAIKASGAASTSSPVAVSAEVREGYLKQWARKHEDDVETHMVDIHHMAETGRSVIEPMRTRLPTISWDEILIRGGQLAKLPLNEHDPVSLTTVIGPDAAVPLVIEAPLLITHMSFGALSREAKLAMATGSGMVKAGMCSGEGGILPECLDAAYRYIFEYVPNKYSVTDEYLQRVDAVEIKIGQSAKPGMGGHLPGHKVTSEIASIRGFPEGQDIISPACFPDIRTPDDLKERVSWLREKTGGKPIGIKFAAGNVEADMEVALHAEPDFITIDGRAGATGAALKQVKAATSMPTIFALHRARKYLNKKGSNASLIITGGFRVSSDMVKALAMGADAIAIGTAAMMACGCQQYRVCSSGKCPVGIATQDPELRSRLKVELSAQRIANYLGVCAKELGDFARLTGNSNVHGLSAEDLCTVNSEISNYTDVEHA